MSIPKHLAALLALAWLSACGGTDVGASAFIGTWQFVSGTKTGVYTAYLPDGGFG
jgi:hypothetical protein